ncbi:MAG: hypothetical protein J0H74_09820 [Chitinophagaceae bacterium]|nr:hypothetical protein [Chitinophagaceae bacterium]
MHYAIGFPQQKAALVIMSNSSNGESIFKELVEKLTDIFILSRGNSIKKVRIPIGPNTKKALVKGTVSYFQAHLGLFAEVRRINLYQPEL